MRIPTARVIEMVIGAILLGLALIYLNKQYEAVNQLVKTADDGLFKDENLYQQYNDVNLNLVPEDELYAIIMGYREYPIVIDGQIIDTDGNDYEYYFSLIKDGFYRKSYSYDANHKVVQVIFTYEGTL